MRNRSGWWFIVLIMIALDLYVFQIVKEVTSTNPRVRLSIFLVYWLLSAISILFVVLFPYFNSDSWPKTLRNYLFATIAGLFVAKLLAATFFLVDDLRRMFTWVINKVYVEKFADNSIPFQLDRSAFLNWLGLGIGTSFFSTFVYGFSNKYNYHVKQVNLAFNTLPASFKGLKIVQISDVHSGSFGNKEAVKKGIEKILSLQPDVIFFTGDLVNDHAGEMEHYADIFSQLKAPMGVFSTLGNHDYGDYVNWPSPEAKRQNLEDLKQVHRNMGWRLLMNEHVLLQRNNDAIAIIGIENWSALARFPKYGKMDVAYAGTEKYPFKILLSHDPTHWDAQVRPQYPDVDLMLSGHTHGMQFGLETPFFKWSPVKWVYKQWAGLYEEGQQKLYVNRGYGFLGYPGRVGIMPEITVINLV